MDQCCGMSYHVLPNLSAGFQTHESPTWKNGQIFASLPSFSA